MRKKADLEVNLVQIGGRTTAEIVSTAHDITGVLAFRSRRVALGLSGGVTRACVPRCYKGG